MASTRRSKWKYISTYDDVKEWLRTGQIDLAFLSSTCREEFNLTELFKEPLLCITPADWPEPPNGVMTPALMDGQNFVVQWDATDAEMRQFLKKYGLSTERRCHVIDDQSNIAMVEAGLGISIMPRCCCASAPPTSKFTPSTGGRPCGRPGRPAAHRHGPRRGADVPTTSWTTASRWSTENRIPQNGLHGKVQVFFLQIIHCVL